METRASLYKSKLNISHFQMLKIFAIIFWWCYVKLFIDPLSGLIHFTQVLMQLLGFFQSVKSHTGQRLQSWELFFNITLQWGQLKKNLDVMDTITADLSASVRGCLRGCLRGSTDRANRWPAEILSETFSFVLPVLFRSLPPQNDHFAPVYWPVWPDLVLLGCMYQQLSARQYAWSTVSQQMIRLFRNPDWLRGPPCHSSRSPLHWPR